MIAEHVVGLGVDEFVADMDDVVARAGGGHVAAHVDRVAGGSDQVIALGRDHVRQAVGFALLEDDAGAQECGHRLVRDTRDRLGQRGDPRLRREPQ